MDVALASCMHLPEPDFDAEPLARALAAAGLTSRVLAWDDPAADWSRATLTVLRSTWNYPLRRDAFVAWAARTAEASELWNPLPLVRWNSHKSYLLELADRGVPITPTVLLRRGAADSLAEILDSRGWPAAVVKPAVSAASYRTMRVDRSRLEGGEAHLRGLLAERDVLVQRYLTSVEDHGERALVWIDGDLTHAVRKSPRFEGQDEAVSGPVEISDEEARLARRVLDALDVTPLYARVDVAPGPRGTPVLMELELIEPSLFFAQGPAGLARFVAAVRRRLAALR